MDKSLVQHSIIYSYIKYLSYKDEMRDLRETLALKRYVNL